MRNIIGHIKTILIHKWWVFYYCCKFHIPYQGLVHDLSKFSPTEFKESIKFYQGGKASPIPAAKNAQGYSLAWQHHKGRNPHHYEYWTDNYDTGGTTICMPFKYVLEMIADYLAAGRTYNGKSFTISNERDWWNNRMLKAHIAMDINTANFVTFFFEALSRNFKQVTNRTVIKYFNKLYDNNFYLQFSSGAWAQYSLQTYASMEYNPREIKELLNKHEQ